MKEESRKAQKRRIIRVGIVLKAFLERESASTTLLSKLLGVDAQWAHYFHRRWILPLQEIIEERDKEYKQWVQWQESNKGVYE